MSEKLCTLRGTGGGGGRYTETSLWTNSAPTSNFNAQTVTLSDSLSNYKYILIKYCYNTSNTDITGKVIFPVDSFKNAVKDGSTNHIVGGLSIEGANNVNYTRNVYYVSDTSVAFSLSMAENTTGTYAQGTIPLEILGLNELDHGTKYTTNASEIAFKNVSANTIPTFTTVAEAKAIWLTINYASAYRALQITNVNPTTGEINNDSLYKIDTNSLGNIEPLTGNKFIVTSNSVTMQNAPSTAATQQSLIYTY